MADWPEDGKVPRGCALHSPVPSVRRSPAEPIMFQAFPLGRSARAGLKPHRTVGRANTPRQLFFHPRRAPRRQLSIAATSSAVSAATERSHLNQSPFPL
uniref:Uncharacterized protein n=1 Tax=Plectus sambesii TaxID=2011161 RepID=A0A914XF00_9BILA